MQKPTDAIEKEFNNAGVFFLEANTLAHPSFEGAYVGVEVEFAVPAEAAKAMTAPDFSVSVLNRRGVAVLMTDWRTKEEDGQKIMTFKASMRIPEQDAKKVSTYPYPRCMAMTFQDLCFYAGNEAIPADYKVDTYTKQRPDTVLSDLGWHLSSRYVDAVIDALGILNNTMLSGCMEEAILYGVVTKS